jgi:peptidoglycan/LPS O-acetylase OafA/YrhL
MKANRIDYIDGIKGICAIIVLISHLNCVFRPNVSLIESFCHIPFLRRLGDGNLAVSIFIILSSFITCTAFNRKRDDIMRVYRKIIVKRYFRLSLPIAAVLLLSMLCKMLGIYYNMDVLLIDGFTSDWISIYKQNIADIPLSMLMSPFGIGCIGWLNIVWMIKYVFLGTFLCVLIDIALYNCTKMDKIICCSFVCLLLYFYDYNYINIIIGYLFANELFNIKWGGQKYITLLFFVLLAIHGELVEDSYKDNVIVATGIVGIVLQNVSIQRFFQIDFIHKIGKSLSFEIFLLQIPVIYSFTCYMILQRPMSIAYVLIIYLFTIIVVLLCSVLFKQYITPMCTYATNKVVDYLLK